MHERALYYKSAVYMTIEKIEIGDLALVNADCLIYLRTLPDNCIDLILTDPPYFKVKTNNWDNQWETVTDYLLWLDEVFAEFWRVLKPGGSLYCFCGHKLSADTELLMRQRFNVLNHIIWAKPSGRWNGANKESFRVYFPATERALFAEHYGSEDKNKAPAGYPAKSFNLKGTIFAPIIERLADEKKRLGISEKEIINAVGSYTPRHWFSKSQWNMPNKEQYELLHKLFNEVATSKGLISELPAYELLTIQYSELKHQYDQARRPFTVSVDVPHTDVWHYPPVQFYPGKHPCEKPLVMMKDIIRASSREGDVVADFFLGGGNSLLAAKELNRKGIGVELETERFLSTVEKLKN